MPSIYYKTFKVPFWVVLEQTPKTETVLAWFAEKGARVQEWPSKTFGETVESFRKKGWHHVFEVPKDQQVVIPPQLLALAVIAHIEKTMGPNRAVAFRQPLHRLDRRVSSPADYERLFNTILAMQEPTMLSQIFQIAERCHSETGTKQIVWVTTEPCDRKLLTYIADKVITVGETGADINLKGVGAKTLDARLEEEMSQVIRS